MTTHFDRAMVTIDRLIEQYVWALNKHIPHSERSVIYAQILTVHEIFEGEELEQLLHFQRERQTHYQKDWDEDYDE